MELLPIALETHRVDIGSDAPYIPPEFTKELTKIGGLSPCGRFPIYRLAWGGSERIFSHGEMRLKYPKSWKTVQIGWTTVRNGKEVAVPVEEIVNPFNSDGTPAIIRPIYGKQVKGVQAWFLEQWMPPSLACPGWEALRYEIDIATGTKIDIMGPPPVDGQYKCLIKLQNDAGEYLQPNAETLEWVRRVIYLKNQDPWLYNLAEFPPAHIVERRLREALAEEDFQREQRANAFGDQLGAVLWDHKDKFIFNDPTIPTPHSGNFFVPGQTQQTKGLVLHG